MSDPLVSILIPAYNAEATLAETLRSALGQTWPRKEIIVVDDGSTDSTPRVVRNFASQGVKLISTANGGLSAAVNVAYRASQGEYIQELDADDLMSATKIERQLVVLRERGDPMALASSPWAYFYFRPQRARFVPHALCNDLAPVEWLLRKLGQNLHMQNATWLMSRELAEAAGPWKEDLRHDQDGEYYARVVARSSGVLFVPQGKVFYRTGNSARLSFVGESQAKKDSLLVSMKLHMQYIRSLEDSPRVRQACLTYMQNWFEHFYPDQTNSVAELQRLAAELGGHLHPPALRSKYAWIEPLLGREAARSAQLLFPQWRMTVARSWDKAMHQFEVRRRGRSLARVP